MAIVVHPEGPLTAALVLAVIVRTVMFFTVSGFGTPFDIFFIVFTAGLAVHASLRRTGKSVASMTLNILFYLGLSMIDMTARPFLGGVAAHQIIPRPVLRPDDGTQLWARIILDSVLVFIAAIAAVIGFVRDGTDFVLGQGKLSG